MIGVAVVAKQGEPAYFQSAYDYREHEAIPGKYHTFNLHNRITALMESRGGIGDPPQGIDDGKITPRLSTQPWFRIASLGIFSLSLFASIKTWRKKNAANFHLNPDNTASPAG